MTCHLIGTLAWLDPPDNYRCRLGTGTSAGFVSRLIHMVETIQAGRLEERRCLRMLRMEDVFILFILLTTEIRGKGLYFYLVHKLFCSRVLVTDIVMWQICNISIPELIVQLNDCIHDNQPCGPPAVDNRACSLRNVVIIQCMKWRVKFYVCVNNIITCVEWNQIDLRWEFNKVNTGMK